MLQSLFSLAATGSFCWFLTSDLWIGPHWLSYANETIRGPLHLSEHLLGSNLDWWRDLKYILCSMDLKEFGTEHENRKLAFEALYNPQDLGFPESYSVEVKSSLKALPPAIYWLNANFEGRMRGSLRSASDAKYSPAGRTIVNGLLQYSRPNTYRIRKVLVE